MFILTISPLRGASPASAQGKVPDDTRLYRIVGHVRLAGSGDPLPYFTLYLERGRREIGRTWSDAAGAFRFDDVRVPPGRVRILATPTYPFYSVRNVIVDLADRFEVGVEIEAKCEFEATHVESLRVDGWVTLWDGETPAERVKVLLSRGEDELREVWSDQRGFYHLDERGLPPGDYCLEFISGNDLLALCTETIRIEDEDVLRKIQTTLQSPLEVPLRRVSFYGRTLLGSSDRWGIAGSTVLLSTGSHVLAKIESGGGGYFLREKVYVPRGVIDVRVSERAGLFGTVKEEIIIPPDDGKVPTVQLELRVHLRGRTCAVLTAGILLAVLGTWLIFRGWIGPEWREIRRRVSHPNLPVM